MLLVVYHPVAVMFFSRSGFWERSQVPKLRGSIKKKVVHFYRSTRQQHNVYIKQPRGAGALCTLFLYTSLKCFCSEPAAVGCGEYPHTYPLIRLAAFVFTR